LNAPTGQWSGGFADWTDSDTAYLSIAFSWRLPDAYTRACWYRSAGYQVRAGGPALFTSKGQAVLAGVAELGGNIPDAVARHNPMATFASRGCDVNCWWCIVPKMEGHEFTEFPDFIVRPVLCDNNLSGLSIAYQRHIVGRYQAEGVPLLDANSGFAPAVFDDEVYALWRPINRGPWRFAYDCLERRLHVERVMRMLRDVSPRRKRVYVMIGNEPVDACLQRIQEVIAWGGEPHVQPFMKLNTLQKRPAILHDWTQQALRDVARWTNRYLWKFTPLDEYRAGAKTSRVPAERDADLFGVQPL
jgi:hypothetical protein